MDKLQVSPVHGLLRHLPTKATEGGMNFGHTLYKNGDP